VIVTEVWGCVSGRSECGSIVVRVVDRREDLILTGSYKESPPRPSAW